MNLCVCGRSGSTDESAVTRLLRSFFLGGFECSTHRRADGERLDLIASSGHDRLALEDYLQRLRERLSLTMFVRGHGTLAR